MSKKIISLILMVGVIGGTSTYLMKHDAAASSSKQNIKVMAYKSSAKQNENGYQIDKYENLRSAAWINDNEVLTLTKKGDFKNPDQSIPIKYCSIYNLNTKKSKDFKDVNIDEFLGVSPDKKYVLYAEARTIPKVGGEEWKKALDSGDLLHKNVKVLNLSTGEITNVNTEKINSDSQFIWVGKNKILANYFEKWAVIDTTGKVYSEGSYNSNKYAGAWIAGTDDIKDLGDSVEGKFYYTQFEEGKEGIKLLTTDVKTKEIKNIYSNQYSLHAQKKGKTIIMDNYNNNGEKSSEGVYVNRTFGSLILNESGKVLQDIKLPKGKISHAAFLSDYVLSPDGSKAVYIESDHDFLGKNSNPASSIKVIDTKTGAVKEIVKDSYFKDKNIQNESRTFKVPDKDGKIVEKKVSIKPGIMDIFWDSTGTSLTFTYGIYDPQNNENKINANTYIVSFDN